MNDDERKIEKALNIILQYGSIDGAHHKQWVLTQVVKILTHTDEKYKEWCEDYSGDPEDEDNYYGDWDEGIAP